MTENTEIFRGKISPEWRTLAFSHSRPISTTIRVNYLEKEGN